MIKPHALGHDRVRNQKSTFRNKRFRAIVPDGRAGDPAPTARHRQGVIFLTLEDETGIVNVIVWCKLFERFRRAVISGRMLRPIRSPM